jgi:hypothetical protein
MADQDPIPIAVRLLPKPRQERRVSGVCSLVAGCRLDVQVDDGRVVRAARRWEESLVRSRLRRGGPSVLVAVEPGHVPHLQGYRLSVRPDGIEILGGSSAGCFYALQTLTQITDFRAGTVPCCTIEDWPDFETRGLLHDVTRGKVPTPATLKLLVDRLALLKVNQLQLYIEHAFVFPFDPEVCGPDEGLTPDEVRELDTYCHERFIDLVPALATFGHMGRVLSMPKYRHLAEIAACKPWSQMSWPERVRGLTIDCLNPEAWTLVERMWSDVLDAFSSPVVNICGDEPWDLGEGKNKKRLAAGGKGEAYLEHVRRTHEFCASFGRRTQFWSDVVCNYPHLFDRVPRESTVLHWGYDDKADYEGTARFVQAGLRTFVCPGTSGWKRIINAMDLAERNIAAFSAVGTEHGAAGLLNTDWGDHGHFNPLACSWHAICLGAAFGWSTCHPSGRAFDELFGQVVLGIDDATIIPALRAASAWADRCETWRMLWMPLRTVADDPGIPDLEQAERAKESAREALRLCEQFGAASDGCGRDFNELTLACRFSELLAEKITIAHQAVKVSSNRDVARETGRTWTDRLAEAADAYADCWRLRNKPSGLADILRILAARGDEIREVEL